MSVIIDNTRYDVHIVNDEQAADVLDKYAERTNDGVLHHEVLGTYYNFEIEFEPIQDPELHERFYNDLTAPKNVRTVTIPGLFTTYTFDCYIRVDKVKMVRHKLTGNLYEGLKVSFIAIGPARRP
jgi:hypothetical protein